MLRPLLLVALAASVAPLTAQQPLSLAGTWRARIDEADAGLAAGWARAPLRGTAPAALPGSLAQSGLGHVFDPESGHYRDGFRPPYVAWPSAGYTDEHRRDELGALVPARMTFGPTWFEREIEIPEALAGRELRLILERVKWTSRLWIDGREIEGLVDDSLHTPHRYELPPLRAGAHRFTLRIDNRPAYNIGFAGHGYGFETESMWCGVVGDMLIEPLPDLRVERVRVAPGADLESVHVDLWMDGSAGDAEQVSLAVALQEGVGREVLGEATTSFPVTTGRQRITVPLQHPAQSWEPHRSTLYELVWTVRLGETVVQRGRERVGLRSIERDGDRLLLNGRPLFLRGNLDCAIHPHSHTPPTDRAWWEKFIGLHVATGFNHIRFHTWCPPEIAFDVADERGVMLQVETAYWVDDWIADTAPHPAPIGADPAVDRWVLAEAQRLLDAYGHHPSFLMLCLGNEFGNRQSDWGVLGEMVAALQADTDQQLIAATTARQSVPSDDYHVTHRTAGGRVRGLGPPHTDWDFGEAVAASALPVIAHETGQRASWPDFGALQIGLQFGSDHVVRAPNLERLRLRAEAAGVDFHHHLAGASALFAETLYKHEHEALRRTPGIDGYQLLMLHDFTGQGEALVGLFDAFLEPKPGISRREILEWNAETTPLARFASSTWTTDQTFEAQLLLSHHGAKSLEGESARWTLQEVQMPPFDDVSGPPILATGDTEPTDIAAGSLAQLGRIRVPLDEVEAPAWLRLTVTVDSPQRNSARAHQNSWSIWVYPRPDEPAPEPHADLRIVRRLDDEALQHLEGGGRLLLLPHGTMLPSARRTSWASTFWTGAWGWGDGLGLLVDWEHRALAGFPTAWTSDFQWRELAEGALAISLPPELPRFPAIVEQIPDFHRPAREALVFQTRVGAGRLLVCGCDLTSDLDQRHVARTLRHSLIRYASSEDFVPRGELSPAAARELLRGAHFGDTGVVAISADSAHQGHGPERVLDGDPKTIWHTPWGAVQPPCPHHLDLDFGEPRKLRGLDLLHRRDGENGRIAAYAIHISDDGQDWGEPVQIGEPNGEGGSAQIRFPPLTTRFLRLVATREIHGRDWSSLAELAPIWGAE